VRHLDRYARDGFSARSLHGDAPCAKMCLRWRRRHSPGRRIPATHPRWCEELKFPYGCLRLHHRLRAGVWNRRPPPCGRTGANESALIDVEARVQAGRWGRRWSSESGGLQPTQAYSSRLEGPGNRWFSVLFAPCSHLPRPHDPKVEGSNPSPATKTLDGREFSPGLVACWPSLGRDLNPSRREAA
jgi:hypothetical protein